MLEFANLGQRKRKNISGQKTVKASNGAILECRGKPKKCGNGFKKEFRKDL